MNIGRIVKEGREEKRIELKMGEEKGVRRGEQERRSERNRREYSIR